LFLPYLYAIESMYMINASRISITTPPARCAALFEEAKVLYSAEAPDSQKILDFVGAPVEELANKTALKEYYAHNFEVFAGALLKNKKKLNEGYDPTRREPKEKLQQEYGASMAKLAPLMRRIKATDELIDAIVYRLYGLNEDEIKIVEGSISGEKNAEGSKT
jgi:hypothetical protein